MEDICEGLTALLYESAISGTEPTAFAYSSMGTRGVNFLDKWTAEHLPNALTEDVGAITDLAERGG
jgi:1,6-anhydro-N-acetylmuramate kinase